MEGLDLKWLIGQGIAVAFAVVLLLMFFKLGMMFMAMLRDLISKVERMHVEQTKAYGQMVGAFRWLGEVIRKKMNIDPPSSPTDGFPHHRDSEEETHRHRRSTDAPGTPRRPDVGSPTPKAEDFFHE